MRLWNLVLFIAIAMMAISSVAEGQTQNLEGGQGVKWVPDDGAVPENAIRVRVGKGFPLCRGPFAEDEDRKDYWRDIGVRKPNGQCHSLRVKKELKFQDEFFYLVPDIEAAEGRIAEAVAGATQGMVPETEVHEAVNNARQEWETEVEGRIKQEIMMALEARNEGIRNLINEFHMNATLELGADRGHGSDGSSSK